jgi:hypothetical protein
MWQLYLGQAVQQYPLDLFFLPDRFLQDILYITDRGGHRHLQIGRMLAIDLISEPPPATPTPDVCIQSVGICVARRGRVIHS